MCNSYLKQLSPLLLKAAIGLSGSCRAACFKLREMTYLNKKIVACVFSTGERSETASVDSIKKQSWPVTRIEIINNVNPMHKAFNHMFSVAADADYILCVDADMVLDQNCTHELLRLASHNILYSLGTLRDPILGKVGYVKLLNMELVRRLGIRFRDVHGCDVDFNRQAAAIDPSIQIEAYTLMRKTLGVHRPDYTAREIFRKNQIEKKKRGNTINRRLLLRLTWLYLKSGNTVLLAAILGEIMQNPDTSTGEVSPESGLETWTQACSIIGSTPTEQTFGFADTTKGRWQCIKDLSSLFNAIHR